MIEKLLVKLGSMLKKRKRPSFEQELRTKLLQKAEALNDQPVSRWKALLNWRPTWRFNGIRLIPVTAFVLLVAVASQFLLPSREWALPGLVDLAEAKDYYTLTPEVEDSTGVARDSAFLLRSKGSLDTEEVQEFLHVEPAVDLAFERVDDQAIRIIPQEDLAAGGIYVFSLAAQNLEASPYPKEYSWAYEVSESFRVTGTLPGNQKIYVPTNTGIEVLFSYGGVTKEDFKNAFSIEPTVSGQFEVHDKKAIFAPSGGLKEATVYTVTLAGNLGLTDSDKTLGDDYVFAFETSQSTRDVIRLNFSKNIYEFSPMDSPNLNFYYSNRNDSKDQTPTVGFTVFGYASAEDYLKALQLYESSKPWASLSRSRFKIPTENLNVVMEEAEYTVPYNDSNTKYLELPHTLSEGFYLVQMSSQDVTDQAFIQVSNRATYINISQEKSLVWVNDIESGKPVANALVKIEAHDLESQTNADGMAVFENIYELLDPESGSREPLILSVNVNDESTFYDASVYLGYSSPNDGYWQLLQTDRETYLPTDVMHYWGFIQGREEAVSGMATVSIKESSSLLYEQDVELHDGKAFEGEFQLEKLAPGYYSLNVMQGEAVLSETWFSVQAYVKPAYQIVAEADKTALFSGDTANITISARFFEGTPVVDTELRVSYSEGKTETLKTDANGEIHLTWVAQNSTSCEGRSNCPIYSNELIAVTPVQEELADIETAIYFSVFRSSAILNDRSKDSVMNMDEFHFKTYSVNLDQIDHDRSVLMSDQTSIYGEANAASSVGLQITQVDWVRVENGEYYDEQAKVVRKKYRTEERTELVADETLYPDENGNFTYMPQGFSSEHGYRVNIQVNDGTGRYYNFYRYLGSSSYGGYTNLSSIQLTFNNGEDGVFKLGEKVEVTARGYDENDELVMLPGTYLFTQSQNGLRNYSLSESPVYSFAYGEEDVPNVYVDAVYFDGELYRKALRMAEARIDTSNRRITVELNTDKEEYQPGEDVSLTVQASKEAQVSLYLVDEAYYALYEQSLRDPLESLYQRVGAGYQYRYLSHEYTITEDAEGDFGGCFIAGTQILMADGRYKVIEDIVSGDKILTRRSAWNAELVEAEVGRTTALLVGEYLLVNGDLGVTEEHILFINGQWQAARALKLGDSLVNKDGKNVIVKSIEIVHKPVMVYNFEVKGYHSYFADDIYVHNDKEGEVRADFRDTALFTVVETDASGRANINFTLPDNITSWRVSAIAVSGGTQIHAGYGVGNVRVSKDVFVNPVINSSYLSGDQPSIPVRAYGDALASGEAVDFRMSIDALDYENIQSGIAFESTYFDLPPFVEGVYRLVTSVEAEGGSDSIALETEVFPTHLSRAELKETALTDGVALPGSENERSTVDFVNNEVSTFYGTLLRALYQDGDRSDEALARSLAALWLKEYLGQEPTREYPFEAFLYQGGTWNSQYGENDGGVALLPYADVDLELTAQFAALAPDQFSKNHLLRYLEGVLESPDHTLNEKIMALYGLAGMEEAYLTELNYLTSHYEMDRETKLYAALTYAKYGDDSEASTFFIELMSENFERAEDWAFMATLADQLSSSERDPLWEKALRTEDEEQLWNAKMLYIKSRLERGAQSVVSFKLNGEKIELKNNAVESYYFLPEELEALEITGVNGEVLAISSYQVPIDLEQLELDSRISIGRSYSVNGETVDTLNDQAMDTVSPGDLVKIRFSVDIPRDLWDQGFRITEYLPSGLQTATYADVLGSLKDSNDGSYRHPYQQVGQAVNFYVYCNTKSAKCYGTDFYYLARVINKGSFIVEPAVLQSFEDVELINISGERGTLKVE